MTELRRSERKRSYMKAQARFNSGYSVMNCLIRNISDTGARLELSEQVTLPAQFELYLPIKERTYSARIVWRSCDMVGVEFLDADSVPLYKKAVGESGGRIELSESQKIIQLEMENAQLRSELIQMKQQLEILRVQQLHG